VFCYLLPSWRNKVYITSFVGAAEIAVYGYTVVYVLGTPETSLRGRSTRTARSVRKSKLLDDVVPLADIVINLPHQQQQQQQ